MFSMYSDWKWWVVFWPCCWWAGAMCDLLHIRNTGWGLLFFFLTGIPVTFIHRGWVRYLEAKKEEKQLESDHRDPSNSGPS